MGGFGRSRFEARFLILKHLYIVHFDFFDYINDFNDLMKNRGIKDQESAQEGNSRVSAHKINRKASKPEAQDGENVGAEPVSYGPVRSCLR